MSIVKSEASYIIYSGSGNYYAKNGSTGVVDYSGSNAATVLQNTISAVTGSTYGGKIVIRDHLNLGSTGIVVSFTGDNDLIIEGISPKKSVLSGSADPSMLDVTNTSWTVGKSHRFELKNLRFQHDTQSAAAITLDLTYSDAHLENVHIYNVNATKRGTGSKVGPYDNSGLPVWKNVYSSKYAVCFDFGIDHIISTNLYGLYPGTEAFYIHNCTHTLHINPHIFWETTGVTAHAFHFDTIRCGTTVFNPIIEKTTTGYMFYLTNMDVWQVSVYEIASQTGSTTTGYMKLTNDFDNITINSNTHRYKTRNSGYYNLTSQSGSFAHGMATGASVVTLTASGSNSAGYLGGLYWYPSGSFGSWVVQTGSGTVGVYWRAEV